MTAGSSSRARVSASSPRSSCTWSSSERARPPTARTTPSSSACSRRGYEQKRNNDDFRCKSFLVELIVAHLADHGWKGRPLDLDDLTVALEQVFAFIAATRLKERISFTDYYPAGDLPTANGTAMEVFDPVNPANNVVKDYSIAHREMLANAAADALDAISEAAYADTKGRALSAWKRVFGPGFGI